MQSLVSHSRVTFSQPTSNSFIYFHAYKSWLCIAPAGNPGPPYDGLVEYLVSLSEQDQTRQKTPVIVSVDVPSGWHVEDGEISGKGMKPHMLVISNYS